MDLIVKSLFKLYTNTNKMQYSLREPINNGEILAEHGKNVSDNYASGEEVANDRHDKENRIPDFAIRLMLLEPTNEQKSDKEA